MSTLLHGIHLNLILAQLLLLFSLGIQAQNDVYVSIASGYDTISCGGVGSPCQTIQYAADTIAVDGDTIRIDTGVYGLPTSVSSFTPVVKLPQGKSLHFIGSTFGQGTRINGDSTRRGFQYFYSGTGCSTGSANDGIDDTLHFSFQHIIVEECKITEVCGTTSYAYGGGMRIDCDTASALYVNISQCIFRNNQAYDSPGSFAGGRSASGGAIFIFGRRNGNSNQGTHAEAHISQCDFSQNSANQNWNGGHGGAVLLRDLDTASVTNSSFCDNFAYSQSADNGDLQHDRNAGGAICFYDLFNSSPGHGYAVDECTFINNSATTNGGAGFTYNSEGGAIFLTKGDVLSGSNTATVWISNSNFYNNFIETGIEHIDNNGGTIDTTAIGFNGFYNQFEVGLGPDTSLCEGDTMVLNASIPGGIYLWSNGSTSSTLTVTDSGTYAVTVTVGQCTVADTIEIDVAAYPVVNLGNDTTLCPYDSITLDVTTPNATYTWSTGDTTASIVIVDSAQVWVEVDVSGCASSDTMILDTVNIVQNAIQPDTIICVGDSLILDATSATNGANYLWNTGSTASSIVVNSAGTFMVTVSVSSCSIADSMDLTLQAYPDPDLGPDTTICPFDSLGLNAFYAGASYDWSTGATSASITYQDSGQVWVNVSINGCSASDTIEVDTVQLWSNVLDPDTILCPNASMTTSAFVSGASYLWQNGSTGANLSISSAGNYWVVVTKQGCSVSDSMLVEYVPQINDIIGDDQITCEEDTIILQVAQSNLDGIFWSNGSIDSVRHITTPGVYAVTVDDRGCLFSDSVEAVFKPLPVVDLGPDTAACEGEVIWLDVYTDGATYLWSYDDYDSPFFPAAVSGKYSVTVTLNGCVASDTIEVDIDPIPELNLDEMVSFCEGDSFLLNARGPAGVTYLWNDSSDNRRLMVYDAGTYTVTATDGICSSSDSVHVSVFPIPSFDLGPDQSRCEGEKILLDPAVQGASYLWQDGSTDSVYQVKKKGTYWVVVGNGHCARSDTFRYQTRPGPKLRHLNDTIICVGDSFSYRQKKDVATEYLWNNSFNAQRYLVEGEEKVFVRAYNDCGSLSDTAYVTVRECDCRMYIPNAFTPGGNGVNDRFSIGHICELEDFVINIYDRWGEKVYTATDPDFGWDGTYRGELLPIGVYAYFIEYRAYLGLNAKKPTPLERRGMINLLR